MSEITIPFSTPLRKAELSEISTLSETARFPTTQRGHAPPWCGWHTPFPPAKIGGAHRGENQPEHPHEPFSGSDADLTEVLVPARCVTAAYNPDFQLNDDETWEILGCAAATPHDTTYPTTAPYSKHYTNTRREYSPKQSLDTLSEI